MSDHVPSPGQQDGHSSDVATSAPRATAAPSWAHDTVWTIEAVQRLGLTTDVETAASILGISRTKAYALARSGEFPVHLVRIGRRYIVPIPALLDLLGAGGTH